MQADDQQVGAFQGQWWRFSSYELAGAAIRPAPGAVLESYDPWESHRKPGELAPYVELGRLGEAIRAWHEGLVAASLARFRAEVAVPAHGDPAQIAAYVDDLLGARAGLYAASVEVPEEISRLICAWCERFGLLGIFQQETLAVNLEASAEALLDLSEFAELPVDHMVSTYRRFERSGGAWRSLLVRARERESKGTHPDLPRKSWGEFMLTTSWPLDESRLPAASVLHRGLGTGELPAALDLVPLGSVRQAYFGLAGGFPEPHSEQFWRAYREDVVAFASYAVALADALLGVQVPDHKQRAPHLARLNEMLGPVSLVVAEEQGRPQAHVASPSLLGALAAMAFFDIRGGVRFAHCQRCAKLFCSPRTDRRFCSPRCQDAAKKRRRYANDEAYRQRERASARQRAASKPAARGAAGGEGEAAL